MVQGDFCHYQVQLTRAFSIVVEMGILVPVALTLLVSSLAQTLHAVELAFVRKGHVA